MCRMNCTHFSTIQVDKLENELGEGEHLCKFADDDDGCRFQFKYREEDNQIIVTAQTERDCPPKVFLLGIVLGVVAAVVLLGLAMLLLWKLVTTIHDRREFAKFEAEREKAKWNAVRLKSKNFLSTVLKY